MTEELIQTNLQSDYYVDEDMKVSAKITISNGTFEEWAEFFETYKNDRERFISGEVVKKVSFNEARVEFEIQDLQGLTALSSRNDIRSREEEFGVVTEII